MPVRRDLLRFVLLGCQFLAVPAVRAGEAAILRGPVEARVLDVLDGDTFLAEAHVWPSQFVRVHVRIRGIDTPEKRGRCAAEKGAALKARAYLAWALGSGEILISNIAGAKYYGRVLADVATPEADSVAAVMLESGMARPYHGGRRGGWC